MRILVDMDDVLCQWSNTMKRLWNEEHKDDPARQVGEIKIWDTNNFLGPGSKHFVLSHMRDASFWANLWAVPGAIEGFDQLHKDGHDVRIVTQVIHDAAGPSFEGKVAWLRKEFPWFDLRYLIVTADKNSVRGDMLFDDSPHQLSLFKSGIPVALDYAYNRHVDCIRVADWNEFLALVRRYDGSRPRK